MIVGGVGFHPMNDGLDHLNIYSNGRTELGRVLSNFYKEEFNTVNGDGNFMSIEGYFHWLGVSEDCPNRDTLRYLFGKDARVAGRNFKCTYGRSNKYTKDEFQEIICKEVSRKFYRHQNLLIDNILLWDVPIYHYMIFDGNKIKDFTEKYKWFVDCIEKTRNDILESIQ